MKPPPFDVVAPTTVGEALEAASAENASFLAGGQSLMPLLAMRLAQPALLVDLTGVEGMHGVHDPTAAPEPGGVSDRGTDRRSASPVRESAPIAASADGRLGRRVEIGAMTRHQDLAAGPNHPLLATAARHIGHRAIRSRGTFGGSIAHADPAAEWPSVVTALNGHCRISGPANGSRVLPADGFFVGHFQTLLTEGELLIAIDVERPGRWGFAELARRVGDFALALAVVAETAEGWRVVVGGIDSVPLRIHAAEAVLDAARLDPALLDAAPPAGARSVAPSPDVVDDVVGAVIDAVNPISSVHADARYLRAMAGEMTRRALEDLQP